jgi:hypothetical protein
MKNYKIIFLLLFITVATASGVAQTRSKDESSEMTGKELPTIAKPKLASEPPAPDALRTGKLVYVKSSSLLVGRSVVEEKLLARREFQVLGLMITRDAEAADIVLDLHHDVFTKYVYNAIDTKNNLVIAGGKLSSLGGTVAGKVAKRFLKQLMRARHP